MKHIESRQSQSSSETIEYLVKVCCSTEQFLMILWALQRNNYPIIHSSECHSNNHIVMHLSMSSPTIDPPLGHYGDWKQINLDVMYCYHNFNTLKLGSQYDALRQLNTDAQIELISILRINCCVRSAFAYCEPSLSPTTRRGWGSFAIVQYELLKAAAYNFVGMKLPYSGKYWQVF